MPRQTRRLQNGAPAAMNNVRHICRTYLCLYTCHCAYREGVALLGKSVLSLRRSTTAVRKILS